MTLDGITIFIIVLFFVNFAIFFGVVFINRRIHHIIHTTNDRRHGVNRGNEPITDKEIDSLNSSIKWATLFYTLYGNITAIFPLLGILGTVWSLIGLSGTENISTNFSTALNTTFAGLICAIFFKFIDAFISSPLDRALDDADYLIHEHDEEKRISHAP